MKKVEVVLLLLILVLGFALRLYKINRPIGDWHSWRQADTAAVSRNFIKEGFNPLIPKYDDMSSQSNGIENPNRYRFVEFPVYNSLVYIVWLFTGINETYARLLTVFISLGSITALYFLVRKFSNWQTAALASFFFATIPYNVFYSSTILPAPLMVFSLLALYLSFANFLENDKSYLWFFASILFAVTAILTWPFALFFMLPPVYLAFQKYGVSFVIKPKLLILAVVSVLPFIAWKLWMSKFPEGIPGMDFILNRGGIRFKGAFFRWLVSERIGRLILTVTGFPLFVLGFLTRPSEKEKLFYLSILVSTLLYFSVFASGNVRHDYYQIPFMIIGSIYLAKGSLLFFKPPSAFNRFIAFIAFIPLIILMYAFGYYEIRGFYWINRGEIVEAGKAADKLLPKDAKVIASYANDTALLYQTNRHGYPLFDGNFEKYFKNGVRYFISVNPDEPLVKKLQQNCKLISKGEKYVIIEISEECTK